MAKSDEKRLGTLLHIRVNRATGAALATMAQENDSETSAIARMILERAVNRWQTRRQLGVRDASAPCQDAGADLG